MLVSSRSDRRIPMATRTIARLYDTHATAAEVVRELEAAGIPDTDISLVTNNRGNQYAAAPSSRTSPAERTDTENRAASGAGTGATTGAVLGGGAGLLAGLGMLAIPGVGPVVAAGWLVATLAGAGARAAVAAGVPEREAHVYAEGVRRGSSLVTVRTDDSSVTRVEAIMARHQPVDWQARDRDYRGAGWTGFDPDARAHTDARQQSLTRPPMLRGPAPTGRP